MKQLTYLDIHKEGQDLDDLWIALSAITIAEDKDLNVLSRHERRIYQNFENSRRKKEFVGTRAVLHKMARDAGMDLSTFQLKKTDQGRPYGVTQFDNVHVSIAHTHQYLLCGLSKNHSIGVDLEPMDRTIHDRLRERILTSPEHQNGRLTKVDTLRVWTIKEAVVKLTGEGLSGLLSEMAIDRVDDDLFTTTVNGYREIQIYSWQHLGQWIAVAMY